ncbi:MAG: endonuclease/exonuclease/phosphatase family protein [Desulfobacteraceae bacterium]|nr:endonuclease/exonuclease/phosphatase family protein [Desulfobacteraceae bacterium]
MREQLLLNSLNCRGLADGRKRRAVFQWLKTYYPGIVFLQETHSSVTNAKLWEQEWGGKIYFSHGSNCARGVAILFPKTMDVKIENVVTDRNGRFVIIDVVVDEWQTVLCNMYAPTKDKSSEQSSFFKEVFEHLSEFEDKNLILGGDFNVCLNPDFDKSGGDCDKLLNNAKLINDYCEQFHLNDIWCTLNPELKRFSWRGNTKSGVVQSRIDYWLISVHMIYDLQDTDIKPAIKTDHSIITLAFNIKNTQRRGRGFWKFNKTLLKDEKYVEKINECLLNFKSIFNEYEDKCLAWDYLKCELRSITISYACFKAKEMRVLEGSIKTRMEYLENKIQQGDESRISALCRLKKELEDIYTEKGCGIMVRSRAKLIDEDEKCSQYFLNLEKCNNKTRYIKCIIKEDGQEVVDPNLILKEEEIFYKKLYSEKNVQSKEHSTEQCDFLSNLKKLSNEDRQFCDMDISLDELGQNLKKLPNNKSPGCDGFTTEFF